MNTQNQHELFVRWLNGDQTAATRLFAGQRKRVLAFFRRRAPHAAEDLTQKALLACVGGRARMNSNTAFEGYVMTTARRMLWSEYRSRWKEPIDNVDAVPDVQDARDPVDPCRVRSAMHRLPARHRDILQRYYVEGRTGPELSADMCLPEPAIRSRIRRAVLALRGEFLQGAGGEPGNAAHAVSRRRSCAVRGLESLRD